MTLGVSGVAGHSAHGVALRARGRATRGEEALRVLLAIRPLVPALRRLARLARGGGAALSDAADRAARRLSAERRNPLWMSGEARIFAGRGRAGGVAIEQRSALGVAEERVAREAAILGETLHANRISGLVVGRAHLVDDGIRRPNRPSGGPARPAGRCPRRPAASAATAASATAAHPAGAGRARRGRPAIAERRLRLHARRSRDGGACRLAGRVDVARRRDAAALQAREISGAARVGRARLLLGNARTERAHPARARRIVRTSAGPHPWRPAGAGCARPTGTTAGRGAARRRAPREPEHQDRPTERAHVHSLRLARERAGQQS